MLLPLFELRGHALGEEKQEQEEQEKPCKGDGVKSMALRAGV